MENLHNQKNNEKLVAISEKYMLTIREAGSYFNIGIKNMRRLCESNEGEFSIRWGNKYLACRPRFEAYLNQFMVREQNQNDINKKDSEKREFNWKLVGGISFALMTVVGISAGVLGGKFDLKFPKKS